MCKLKNRQNDNNKIYKAVKKDQTPKTSSETVNKRKRQSDYQSNKAKKLVAEYFKKMLSTEIRNL